MPITGSLQLLFNTRTVIITPLWAVGAHISQLVPNLTKSFSMIAWWSTHHQLSSNCSFVIRSKYWLIYGWVHWKVDFPNLSECKFKLPHVVPSSSHWLASISTWRSRLMFNKQRLFHASSRICFFFQFELFHFKSYFSFLCRSNSRLQDTFSLLSAFACLIALLRSLLVSLLIRFCTVNKVLESNLN